MTTWTINLYLSKSSSAIEWRGEMENEEILKLAIKLKYEM